ncbi:MAG: 6-phosphofructokinase [Bacteroidia bacterium]|nr:6-phosphofructokinase [Bacteroidia bacterium]
MLESKVKHIGVLTSGGDAPGMNACIRAVVRTCIYYGIKVTGIKRGYAGIIQNEMEELNARSVAWILDRGGTVLKSSRCLEFKIREGQEKAFENLQKAGVDALVTIGGDGTFAGANAFHQNFGIPVMGVPATIDNDLRGTEATIGFDTACNTAVEAIDQIRDTASSHNRLFFIEVMGRDAGFIALRAGISTGAVATIIPEEETTIDDIVKILEAGELSGKSSSLVIVAEGGTLGSAIEVAAKVKEILPNYDAKVTILGHLQRGGSPSSYDRVIASRLGVAAVEGLMEGREGQMVGLLYDKITYSPITEAIRKGSGVDPDILRISKILSI